MKLENLRDEFPKMPDSMKVMVENKVKKQIRTTKRFAPRRVAAVACIAVMAVGTTVFAGTKIAEMNSHKVDKYAVKTQIKKNSETTTKSNDKLKIKNVKLEMNYLPEGVTREDSGKYGVPGEPNKKAITPEIFRMDLGDEDFEILDKNVLRTEKIQIGERDGVYIEKTKRMDESYSFDKMIYIYFTDKHYVVGLYLGEDISKQEALKIAKGVNLVDSKEADMSVENWSNVKESEEKEEVENGQMPALTKSVDKGDLKMLEIGQKFKEGSDKDVLTAKVTDVKITDNINILDLNKTINNFNEIADKNGKLLQDTIKYYKAGNGKNSVDKVIKTRKVNQKLVYVTVKYTNDTKKTIKDFCYGANLMYIKENGDKYEIYEETPGKNDKWDTVENTSPLNYDEMVYWDVRTSGYHNGIESIKPGETRTVHIGFIVDEYKLPYTCINFTDDTNGLEPEVRANGLIDIRQK